MGGGDAPGVLSEPSPEKAAIAGSPQEWKVPHSQGASQPWGSGKTLRSNRGRMTAVGIPGRGMRCHRSRGLRRWRAHGAGCPPAPTICRKGIPAEADVPGVPGHHQQLLLAAEALPGAPGGGPGGGPEGARVQQAAGGVSGGPARRQQHEGPDHGRHTAPATRPPPHGPAAPEAPPCLGRSGSHGGRAGHPGCRQRVTIG